MSHDEILDNEVDLTEMKKSLNDLQEKLKMLQSPDEIYDVGKIREELKKQHGSLKQEEKEEIKARISELKEFDRFLEMKSEEIKLAKLERIREEEESHQILTELSKTNSSKTLEQNSEQFSKLIMSAISDHAEENSNASKTVKPKKERIKFDEPNRKNGAFIERNIQLAKCGDGILSLTDEEKLRLKTVLRDIEEPEEKSKEQPPNSMNITKPTDSERILDERIKKDLDEIDRKLEEYETKFPLHSLSNLNRTQLEMHDENMKEKSGKGKLTKNKANSLSNAKDVKRLREVDKLINSFNSASKEEIDPLLDEDLQYLIEKCKESLRISSTESCVENGNTPAEDLSNKMQLEIDNIRPSKEKMMELISMAKNNLPKFRFRYHC